MFVGIPADRRAWWTHTGLKSDYTANYASKNGYSCIKSCWSSADAAHRTHLGGIAKGGNGWLCSPPLCYPFPIYHRWVLGVTNWKINIRRYSCSMNLVCIKTRQWRRWSEYTIVAFIPQLCVPSWSTIRHQERVPLQCRRTNAVLTKQVVLSSKGEARFNSELAIKFLAMDEYDGEQRLYP